MKLTRNGANQGIFPELRGSIKGLRWPCFAEIKYDGEATLIAYKKHSLSQITADAPPEILTTNKYGTRRTEWSKLDKIAEILDEHDIDEAVLLAELYYGFGLKGALYQLLKSKEDDGLNLTIFDIGHIRGPGKQMDGALTPLIDRKELLGEIFENNVFLPTLRMVNNEREAIDYFNQVKANGYEGIVLKSLDGFLVQGPCNWVKLKDKDRTIYPVLSIDPVKERIEIAVPNPNPPVAGKQWAQQIAVGVKVVNRFKKNLGVGDQVEIEHQGVLASGSLRHPVYIRKVR